MKAPAFFAALGSVFFVAPAVFADGGMWTFDNFPVARVKAAYGFAPDQAWLDHIRLGSQTIFDVSTNNDIIGGNSGSPLIDREGRVVGAVFDGNIHSLGGDYVFDAQLNRTVAVASTAVEEALAKVYGMQRLVDELQR